jgi:hypothetical protein
MSDQLTNGTDRSSRRQALTPLRSVLFHSQAVTWQGAGPMYMLLDTARDQRIYPRLTEFGGSVQARSLYQGDIGESLANVSPYLLSLPEDEQESCWFAEAGFGQSWGLFVTTLVGLDDLRGHLRKFNIVYREDGAPLVFRFYDPRVLRRFLPLCTTEELRRFFGPIETFLTETAEADALIRFTFRAGELMQTRLPVPARR